MVIDPEGYVVAQHAGEGHAHALERLVQELEAEHEAKGTLRRGDGPYVPPEPVATDLRFPGKAIALPGGDLLVSDTTRHQLVELGRRRRERRSAGSRAATARGRFNEPQGLALLPRRQGRGRRHRAPRAARLRPGERGDRADRRHRQAVVAGAAHLGPALEVDLSSPWDVAWWRGKVWIAMAGVHQLWTYDPATGTVEVAAGTTNEGLVDGPGAEAWFAQPSGLAATEDRLWVADSETSALR